MKTVNFRIFVLALLVIHMAVFPLLTSNVQAAEEAAAAAAGAGSAGAGAGAATAAGITTGTIAAGGAVAAAVAIAVASSGGTTQSVAPATQLQNSSPAEAAAVAKTLGQLDTTSTIALSNAFTVLPTAGEQYLAQASSLLTASEYSTMAGLVANANTGLAKEVAYSVAITNFLNSLGATTSAKYKAADGYFSELAKLNATDFGKITTLFKGLTPTELSSVQSMLAAAVKSDGSADTTALNGMIAVVNTVAAGGDAAAVAAAQADALKTLLTAQHPGATVIITTTHHGSGVYTTVSHVH